MIDEVQFALFKISVVSTKDPLMRLAAGFYLEALEAYVTSSKPSCDSATIELRIVNPVAQKDVTTNQ